MPCEDVSEIIELRLDARDRLTGYELKKMTCGRAVGLASLLEDEVTGLAAADLLTADVEQFLDRHPTDDEAEEYLYLKHHFAIRAGLAVLLGHEGGSIFDLCTAEAVTCDADGGTEFVGRLKIAILTDRIKSCGRACKGCGTKKLSVRERAAAKS